MGLENWTRFTWKYSCHRIYNTLIFQPLLRFMTQTLHEHTSMGGGCTENVGSRFSSFYWLVFVIFMSTLNMIDTFYFCMIFMYVWLEMNLVHFSTLYLSLFKGFISVPAGSLHIVWVLSLAKFESLHTSLNTFLLQTRVTLWCLVRIVLIGSCIWMFGSPLIDLSGKNYEVWLWAVIVLLQVSFVASKGHTIPS